MIRLIIGSVLLVVGLLTQTWLYLSLLVIAGIFLRNFWIGIAVGVILDIAYTYQGVNFSARYVLWGVAAFAISFVIYNMTRLRDTKK